MLGLPGCSVPCGMSPDKMPIGMQLIGAWFSDQTVLNAALAYQSLSEWHRQKPPVDQ
jgi:aspartyl-tRNA(Asn)/glutamyl-tRNA(Gln) amidotransferase subunit A